MMERCYIGLLIFMLLVAAFLVLDGMGHVPVNLFTWYSHVVLHVCKCVFIVYMGRWVCVGLIAGKSAFHASKIKFHMF